MTSCFPVIARAASKVCWSRAGESNRPPAYGCTFAASLVLNWPATWAFVHGLGPTQHIDADATGTSVSAADAARRALLLIPTWMFVVLFVTQFGSLTPS